MKKREILLAALLALTVCASGCGNRESAASTEGQVVSKAGPAAQNQPSQPAAAAAATAANKVDPVQHKVLSFDLEGLTDKGGKKWDVHGKSAESISENEVKIDEVVAHTYGEEGQATITADSGVYDKSKNNVRLEKNVRTTIDNTQSSVGQMVNLPGDAPAAGAAKSRKVRTVITCDGAVEFDYEKNKAYFNKNVRVASEDGVIDADKMTVDLDPSTKKIKEIMAEGNVKITHGENVSYSDKATYADADKKVLLSGQPKIVIYQEGGLEGSVLGKDNASTGN